MPLNIPKADEIQVDWQFDKLKIAYWSSYLSQLIIINSKDLQEVMGLKISYFRSPAVPDAMV